MGSLILGGLFFIPLIIVHFLDNTPLHYFPWHPFYPIDPYDKYLQLDSIEAVMLKTILAALTLIFAITMLLLRKFRNNSWN